VTPDIASLMIKIDASQADTGAASLDKLTTAGGRAEASVTSLGSASKASLGGLSAIPASLQAIDARADALRASVDPLAVAMKRANTEMREADALYKVGAIGAAEYARYVDVLEARLSSAVTAQNLMNAAQARGAKAIGLTATESLNLSRQMADVGVSLAMGMNPLMVMIQQGPQVADIFGQASARGVGFSGALRGMVAAAGPLLPILVAVGAAAAVVAGGVALAANQLNKGGESAAELQKRLGLTDAEMKKMGNTSITMGDVVSGSMKHAGDSIMEAFGPALKWLGGAFQWTFDQVARIVVGASKLVGGVFVGSFYAIGATWRMLPAVLGDATISAANLVVSTIEAMINKAIGAINVVIGFANAAAGALGLTFKLPTLEEMNLGGFQNDFAGAMEGAGKAGREGFERGFNAYGAGFDGFLGGFGDAIRKANRDRNDRNAAALIADRPKDRDFANDNGSDKADQTVEKLVAVRVELEKLTTLSDSARDFIGRGMVEAADAAADAWGRMASNAREAVGGLAAAFDGVSRSMSGVGRGIAGLITSYGSLQARQKDVDAKRARDLQVVGLSVADLARIEADSARESARIRVQSYGDMAEAGSQFFKEGSDGYKVMQVAMIAFRTVETLMSISAMAQKGGEVAAVVAAEGTKSTAYGITAFANTLSSLPFPFNLAAGATVLAALGAVGVAISGGGASAGSVPGGNDMADRQRMQGAGSVLGDANAKSESLANAMNIVAANTNRDLEYSNGMLRALRSIDSQIGTVAAALARSFGAGGMLDASNLGLGTTASGPGGLMKLFSPLTALLPGLFGTSTTRTLQDQGVQFGSGSLDAILSGGLTGSAYQQVATNTKKKFFGLTYSDKTSTSTSTTGLDGDFLRQTELLIGSLRDGVLSAAGTLGLEGAAATLAAFTVNLGKLSFKDMSGTEIQAALEGVFGKLADDMAGAVLPGLTDLQKVGEGLFETLTRVARQSQVIDVTLSSIGKTFGAVGVSSLMARERLIDLFGSLDDFTEQVSFYADTYLTEAERLAPVQNAVTAELARLGLAGVKTRDQFKGVVQGLDVSTAAGSQLFAALMALAPAFAKVTEETQAVADAREALSGAYGRESEALNGTLDTFRTYAADLRKFRDSLTTGPAAALSPEAQYLASKTEFERVAGLATAGNEQALGNLQNVSQAYLDASKTYYASSSGYFADLALVRDVVTAAEASATAQIGVAEQQLQALKDLVSPLISMDESMITVAEAIVALNTALGVPSAPAAQASALSPVANDNSAVVAELQSLRAEMASVRAELQAANEQRGAIAVESLGLMTEQTELQARALRETQAV
jgi:hypothetical protein